MSLFHPLPLGLSLSRFPSLIQQAERKERRPKRREKRRRKMKEIRGKIGLSLNFTLISDFSISPLLSFPPFPHDHPLLETRTETGKRRARRKEKRKRREEEKRNEDETKLSNLN
jgi:hypothetical protein